MTMSDHYPSTDADRIPGEAAEVCDRPTDQLRSRGLAYKLWDDLLSEVQKDNTERPADQMSREGLRLAERAPRLHLPSVSSSRRENGRPIQWKASPTVMTASDAGVDRVGDLIATEART